MQIIFVVNLPYIFNENNLDAISRIGTLKNQTLLFKLVIEVNDDVILSHLEYYFKNISFHILNRFAKLKNYAAEFQFRNQHKGQTTHT